MLKLERVNFRSGRCLVASSALFALAMVVLVATSAAAVASVEVYQLADEPVTVSGSLRGRWEVWNWFNPGKVANGQDDNRYNFQSLDFRWAWATSSAGSRCSSR